MISLKKKINSLFCAPRVEGKPWKWSVKEDGTPFMFRDAKSDYYYYPRWKKVLLHWHLIRGRFRAVFWRLPQNLYLWHIKYRNISTHSIAQGEGAEKFLEEENMILLSPWFSLIELDWNMHACRMGQCYTMHFIREDDED